MIEDADLAACIGSDPDLFFPEHYRSANVPLAKAICNRCAIKAQCLAEAIAEDYDGIWGGTTAYERKHNRSPVNYVPTREEAIERYDKVGALKQFNLVRTQQANEKNVQKVKDKLANVSPNMPATMLAAAKLRVEHPDLTLQELAEMYGVSKDAYSGYLRRFMSYDK